MKEECAYNNCTFLNVFKCKYENERENICFQVLIGNGNDISVTQDNFDLFIEKGINFLQFLNLYE